MNFDPPVLNGNLVRLEPLQKCHAADLANEGKDERIWTYMRYGSVNTREKMLSMIEYLLENQARGTDIPFAVIYLPSDKAIGMTRYMNIEPQNCALEIGGTWYGASYQRTGVNKECKFLLLQYAFENMNVIRVQIKTDLRNEHSQRAIERIGAVREGVMRDHMILPDGTVRSSVYYSILAREWPGVKNHLLALLQPVGEK